MFQRLTDKASAFAGLLDTKARLVARDLEQAGVVVGAYLGAAVFGLLGLGLVLAATIVVLAGELGAPAALAIVGGTTIIMGLVVLAFAHRAARAIRRPSRIELECRAAVLRERLTSGSKPRSTPASAPLPGAAAKLVEAVTEDPRVLGSGAFAVIALLGPRRFLRLAASAASVASFTASVSKLVHELVPLATGAQENTGGPHPGPGVVPDPAAPTPGAQATSACAPDREVP